MWGGRGTPALASSCEVSHDPIPGLDFTVCMLPQAAAQREDVEKKLK
jgi:hypothetical protein